MKHILVIGAGGYGTYLQEALKNMDVSIEVVDGLDFKNFDIHNSAAEYVLVATPNDTHFEIVQTCLKAGKHVLAEKPLALTKQQVSDLYQLASERELKLMVGFVLHRHPFYSVLKKLVAQGQLAAMFVHNNATEGMNQPDWYWQKERSGGWFMVAEIHWYHLLAWLTGITEFRVKSASEEVRNDRTVATQSILNFNTGRLVVDHRLDALYSEAKCDVDIVVGDTHFKIEDWVPRSITFPTTEIAAQYRPDSKEFVLEGATVHDTRDRDVIYQTMIKANVLKLIDDASEPEGPVPVMLAHAMALAAQAESDADQ